ncbi:hypothetical protein NJC38_14200 [Pseudomonas sp. 21LCFQ010]|uniref:hypothetical protein n=1 Tax=Pseudomonas sp. 21LCFQ010 TaxID=2957506 RepID=UPI0020972FE7|nr:hypothetical protein [Pseudomonas sp. 21LCFQ010]MCO8163312.1 hypothetical protein [Pseudomonas sp. 21LCFQ010]
MTALTLKAAREKDLNPIFRGAVSSAIESYGDFVDVIRHVISRTIKNMVRGRNHFEGMGEDKITFHVISQFHSLGFNASHDKQVGGHVDITIEHGDYLWYGEAKIHTCYATLQKGWAQLTTRYMTGMAGEDCGAFLIYNFNKNAAQVTHEWRKVMVENYPDVELGEIEDGLNFASKGIHAGSGRSFLVDHYNIPLYFDPQDRER